MASNSSNSYSSVQLIQHLSYRHTMCLSFIPLWSSSAYTPPFSDIIKIPRYVSSMLKLWKVQPNYILYHIESRHLWVMHACRCSLFYITMEAWPQISKGSTLQCTWVVTIILWYSKTTTHKPVNEAGLLYIHTELYSVKSSWLETTVCNITTHQHLPYILHSLSDDIAAYETSLFFIIYCLLYWTLLQNYMWQMWIIVQLSTLFLSFHKGVSSTLTEHSLPMLLQYNIQSS